LSDITQKITEYCLKLLLNQFGRALDAAPDYLTHLADQTSFDDERTIYLDSMHELRFTRKKVYQAIVQEIEKPFELLLKGTVPAEYGRQGGLVRNVTGATELEEKLALETMLNKAQMKADIPLQNIARSLDAMMGNDWVKNHYNPLDPEFIIRAWVAGIHEMQLHSKGLLGLYALLDSEVLGKLSRIYEKISQYIQSLGVQSASPISDGSQAPEQTSSGDDFEAMFGDIDSISPQSSGQFSAAEIDAVTATTGLMVDTDDIIRKLTELQSMLELFLGTYSRHTQSNKCIQYTRSVTSNSGGPFRQDWRPFPPRYCACWHCRRCARQRRTHRLGQTPSLLP
jgi:hypothetical protein